jgi:ABC-type nitrate/sulfonate/bicarbonate transport system substrate-binding protein
MPAAQAISQGTKYWIGTSSGTATAIGRSNGLPIKSLAVYYRKTPSAIFSRAEDRIAHPRDLYGKRSAWCRAASRRTSFAPC